MGGGKDFSLSLQARGSGYAQVGANIMYVVSSDVRMEFSFAFSNRV